MELENSGMTKQVTVSDYASIKRKQWVLNQILSGIVPAVTRELYKQEYKLSDASFDKDVTWSYQQLRKKSEYETEAIIERHLQRYDYLYSLSVEKGDTKGALQSMKQLEDLCGIKKTGSVGTMVQVNNNNINLPTLSIEQLERLLGINDDVVTIPVPPSTIEPDSE